MSELEDALSLTKPDHYAEIAERIHERWQNANLTHPVEREILAKALREAAADAYEDAARSLDEHDCCGDADGVWLLNKAKYLRGGS